MKFKTMLIFHFTPVRIAIIKKKNTGDDMETKDPHILLVGM
jgi:hypothetical protein